MDLSLKDIYKSSLIGIARNPLIYLLLLVWGLVQGIILVFMVIIGAPFWIGALASIRPDSNTGSTAFFVTVIYVGTIILVLSILSAATRAGALAFGARIRRGEKATTLSFVEGIFRFTWRLFVGGIIVGMLSCIPLLAFATFIGYAFSGLVSDIFTSGWNIGQAMSLVNMVLNGILIAGIFQALIFFWIAPWDEMAVLNDIGFPEALVNSFYFVFSGRNFTRVLALVVANVVIAQTAMILTNLGTFTGNLHLGFFASWMAVLVIGTSSKLSSFALFVLYPFFAFSQLYLLPKPERKNELEIEPVVQHETDYGYPIKV